MVSIADQSAYYDKRWTDFQFANQYSLERCLFILRAISSLEIEAPRICDLGSGAGWLSGILSNFGPTVGVELSPAAVEQAKLRYPTANFLCADATAWEPPAGAFDIVVSQEVLEHIENKRAYLTVVHRALKPGGHLLMTTPNAAVLNAIPTEERERDWEHQPVELPVVRRQLDELLQESGFQIKYRGSVVIGCGRLGLHRLLNSAKIGMLFSTVGLGKAWSWWRGRTGYGAYLTTVAQKAH